MHHARPSGTAALAAVVLASDQLSMPGQQGIRGDKGGHLGQHFASELLGLHCQAATLLIAQPQALVAQLSAQDAVLLSQIVEDIPLLFVDPAGQADQHEPEWVQRLHGDTS